MFQDTADMPGMRNELDRSEKKLEEQESINQELQKIKTVVTFAFGLFYSMQAKHKTVKKYVHDTTDMPGMGNDLDRRSKKKLEEQNVSIRSYKKNHSYFCIRIVLQYAV